MEHVEKKFLSVFLVSLLEAEVHHYVKRTNGTLHMGEGEVSLECFLPGMLL